MATEEIKGNDVPKSNAPATGTTATGETAPKKEKRLIQDIVRGRMPIVLVWMVRFGDQKNGGNKELAELFGTTVGKIMDIKKKSTFAYLPENFKPTEAQKAEGIAWLQKHVGYKDGKVDVLINELEALKPASAEEAAAYEKVRAENRGQLPKTKTGETANAGGGNNMPPAKPVASKKDKETKKESPAATKPSASDLI